MGKALAREVFQQVKKNAGSATVIALPRPAFDAIEAETHRLRTDLRRARRALREIAFGWFGYRGPCHDSSRLAECKKTAKAALRPARGRRK